MLSPDEAELEQLYGPLAGNREYDPGDRISYRLAGEPRAYAGRILWVCEATHEVGMTYIVVRDGTRNSLPDFVFPAAVLAAL